MNHEGTIEDFENHIKVLQAKIDALKERKAVWIPKEGPWRLSPDLISYPKPNFNDHAAGVGAAYATREEAKAAVPLRRRQQLLDAYKREFDPAFKPKFDGSQNNYYPMYNHRVRIWQLHNTWASENPQTTYFSKESGIELNKKLSNGTVVLELGT